MTQMIFLETPNLQSRYETRKIKGGMNSRHAFDQRREKGRTIRLRSWDNTLHLAYNHHRIPRDTPASLPPAD